VPVTVFSDMGTPCFPGFRRPPEWCATATPFLFSSITASLRN